MKYVYLAGPIQDAKDPSGWRIEMSNTLRNSRLCGIDPFHQGVFDDKGHEAHTARSIVDRDHYHSTRCDLLLVNFLDATRVSIGTVMEIAWAYDKHIPIVVIVDMTSGDWVNHPMIKGCASFTVHSLKEAVEMIAITLGDYA